MDLDHVRLNQFSVVLGSVNSVQVCLRFGCFGPLTQFGAWALGLGHFRLGLGQHAYDWILDLLSFGSLSPLSWFGVSCQVE